MEREALVAMLADVIRNEPDVRFAVLFGSRAKGSARPDSDVDVAASLVPGADIGGIAARLSLRVGHEVDVVPLDDPGVPLTEEILRDGVWVHDNVPGAYAAWRSHAWCDLEVDRPWYARMREAWLKRVAARGVLDGAP